MPFLELDDFKMFYKTLGNGEPVLLIHGLGGDTRGWEFQEEELAKHFHLILPDMRAHGQSTVKELGMMILPDQFARDIDALLSHLGHKRVHVVGHSMGGMIAQQFVLDYPHRVNKLVLIDTTPKITEQTVDEVYSWREAMIEGGQEAYFWTSLKSGYSEEWIQNNPEMVQHLKEKSQDVNEAGIVAAGLGLATTEFENRLSEIKAKTLVIHGDEDRVFDIELARILHNRIKDSELKIFEGCGHSPTVQFMHELNEVLIDFLGS
ncbi:MAG: alpha/beta hydrolase [Candidatus Thorarchaeota archaeon]